MTESDPRWSDVDDYIVDHLIGEDPVLEACLAANRKAQLPAIDATAVQTVGTKKWDGFLVAVVL